MDAPARPRTSADSSSDAPPHAPQGRRHERAGRLALLVALPVLLGPVVELGLALHIGPSHADLAGAPFDAWLAVGLLAAAIAGAGSPEERGDGNA